MSSSYWNCCWQRLDPYSCPWPPASAPGTGRPGHQPAHRGTHDRDHGRHERPAPRHPGRRGQRLDGRHQRRHRLLRPGGRTARNGVGVGEVEVGRRAGGWGGRQEGGGGGGVMVVMVVEATTSRSSQQVSMSTSEVSPWWSARGTM